jgi:hypothetical protein
VALHLKRVYIDPGYANGRLEGLFPEELVDVGGTSDYMVKAGEKRIRIKVVLCFKNSLPWRLLRDVVRDLVAYTASRINIHKTTPISQYICF